MTSQFYAQPILSNHICENDGVHQNLQDTHVPGTLNCFIISGLIKTVALTGILAITIGAFCQNPYTISDYYADQLLIKELALAMEERDFDKASRLGKSYLGPPSGWVYYNLAHASWHLKEEAGHLMDSAFKHRLNPDWIDTSNSFYFYHRATIRELKEKHNSEKKPTIQLEIEEIILKDQEFRKNNIPIGSIGDLKNKEKLDSIIKAYGWPSSLMFTQGTGGVEIIFAHQGQQFGKEEFEYYFQLVEALCLSRQEDWKVAQNILEQRFQWFGSDLRKQNKLPDTLVLNFNGQMPGKGDPAPYIASMSKTLCSNSHKNLWFAVNNESMAQEIINLLHKYEMVKELPAEVLMFLKSNGMDCPGPLTVDRINYEIQENLQENMITYRFR